MKKFDDYISFQQAAKESNFSDGNLRFHAIKGRFKTKEFYNKILIEKASFRKWLKSKKVKTS